MLGINWIMAFYMSTPTWSSSTLALQTSTRLSTWLAQFCLGWVSLLPPSSMLTSMRSKGQDIWGKTVEADGWYQLPGRIEDTDAHPRTKWELPGSPWQTASASRRTTMTGLAGWRGCLKSALGKDYWPALSSFGGVVDWQKWAGDRKCEFLL